MKGVSESASAALVLLAALGCGEAHPLVIDTGVDAAPDASDGSRPPPPPDADAAPVVDASPDADAAADADAALVVDATADADATITPTLVVVPTPFDFGAITVGGLSSIRTFTVSAEGAGVGTISADMSGPNAAEFAIVGGTCASASLGPGERCYVDVRYEPTSPGRHLATLQITSASGALGSAALSGTAIDVDISISPTTANFGGVGIGWMSVAVVFTVTNITSSPTGVPSVGFGGTSPSEWTIDTHDCTAPLAVGASCNISVRFTPMSTEGPKDARLEVSASPGGMAAADLTGLALAPEPPRLSPSVVSFGDVPVGMHATMTLVFTNITPAPVTSLSANITGADRASFEILMSSTCGITLAPASSCEYHVRFAPLGTGSVGAALEVTYGVATNSAWLSGNGI